MAFFSNSNDLRTNDPSTVYGLKRGIVKSLKDPQKLNRVQVTLLDEILDTPFADVMADFAAEKAGSVAIPQVGEEVLLGFFDGKISNPVILGGLYNSKNKPPIIIDEKNEIIYSKLYAGLEITLDNKPEKQKVEIKTAKGHLIQYEDEKETLLISDKGNKTSIFMNFSKGEITIKAEKKISFAAGQDAMVLEANKGLEIKSSSGAVDINAKDIKLTAAANLTGKANAQAKFEGSAGAELKSSGPVTIKGAVAKIN